MSAFLKQTIKYILFLLVFVLPLYASALSDSTEVNDCKSVIEYLTENLVAPTDTEAELLCKYINNLIDQGSEHCPTPTNFQAVVNRNSVNLTWDRDPQIEYYLLSALNVNSGRERLGRTDVNNYTFDNLEPGTYVFSLRASCYGGGVSPPAFVSSIIIGDVAVIMPTGQDECVCTDGVLQYSGGAFPPQLLVPWEDELECLYGIYEISMIINSATSVHYARFEVTYNPGDNLAVVNVCKTKRMRVHNSPSTVFGNSNSGASLVEMEFSEDYGILINPQASLFSYQVQVKFCCITEGGPGEPLPGDRNAFATEIIDNNILQAYPNPFDQSSTIEYNTLKDTEASLILYNSQGQMIRRLHDGVLLAGNHQAILEGDDLAPGLYYLRFTTRDQEKLLKMIKL